MACLLNVIHILLLVSIGWQYCKGEEERIYPGEKLKIHKVVKNNFDEFQVENDQLNLKIENHKDEDEKPITRSNFNKKTYDGDDKLSKISHNLEMWNSNDTPLEYKQKKTKLLRKNVHDAEVDHNDEGPQKSKNKLKFKNNKNVLESLSGIDNVNRNFVYVDGINKENNSIRTNNLPSISKNKFVIPKIKENPNMDNNILPRVPGFKFQQALQDFELKYGKSWKFNDERNNVNKLDHKHRIVDNKNEPINTKYRDKSSKNILHHGDADKKYKSKQQNVNTLKNSKHKQIGGVKHDNQVKRNERAIKSHKKRNYHDTGSNTKSKGVIETGLHHEENNDPDYMEKVPDERLEINEEDKQNQFYEPKRFKNNFPKHSIDKIAENKSNHYPEKAFVKTTHLSNIGREEPKENWTDTKEQPMNFSQDVTCTEKSTKCITEQSKAMKPTCELPKEPELSPKDYSLNSQNHEERKEYESFLNGQLVDEFVKAVLKKVIRARKLTTELGFGNYTDETCERCVELKGSNIPELDEMKKSMEIFLNIDKLKCYRIPATMENYLDALMLYKQENTNNIYKDVENENFIFTGDYNDPLLVTDNEIRPDDRNRNTNSLSKNLIEKEKLKKDIFEIKNDDQVLINRQTSNLLEQNTNKNTISVENQFQELDSENELRNENDFKHPLQQYKRGSDRLIDEQSIIPRNTTFSQQENSRINSLEGAIKDRVDAYGDKYNGRLESFGIQPSYVSELDRTIERNPGNVKFDEDRSDALVYNRKIKPIEHPHYREDLFAKEVRSQSNDRPYFGYNIKDRYYKSKGNSINNIADNFLRRISMPKNTKDKKIKDLNIDFLSNDYTGDEEYFNKPQLSMNNWKYEMYPKQHSLDLNDSPNNREEYDDGPRILKRDTQPPLEYEEDNSIIYEVPDIEYDLY